MSLTKKACFLVIYFSAVSVFAIDIPKCPSGTSQVKKEDVGAKVYYCAKSPMPCPESETIEVVVTEVSGVRTCQMVHGPVFYRNEDGTTLLMHYKDGIVEGDASTYAPDGKKILEESFKNGKREGVCTVWYANSGKRMSENHYVNGEKNGASTFWHESGRVERVVNYKAGKREGKYTEWHNNGIKKVEANYRFGIWDGNYRENYSNGKRALETQYKGGRVEGPYVMYYPNGKKSSQRFYSFGKIDGRFTEWNEKGEEETISEYENGLLKKVTLDKPLRELASLKENAQTITVDLDGNGYPDLVMTDPEKPNQSKVYLMKGKSILKEFTLNEPALEVYTARSEEGQFGEPATPRDGLVVWGKGSPTHVYLYDFDKKEFTKTEHAGDN